MWQLKEVVWLELQAWFAGNDVNVQDQWILHKRKLVDQVFHMVSSYQFLPNDESLEPEISQQLSMESSNSLGQDVFYDAQESVESRASDVCLEADQEGTNSEEEKRVEMICEEYE